MTDLSTFRRDAKAMREGEWVSPGVEYGDFEVKTKAIGPKFYDAVNARVKMEARKFGGEDRIPSDVRAKIATEELINNCLLGVRGLSENGQEIDFGRFCDLLKDPSFGELSNAAFIAAGLVGRTRAEDMKESAGNSVQPSASTSQAG